MISLIMLFVDINNKFKPWPVKKQDYLKKLTVLIVKILT